MQYLGAAAPRGCSPPELLACLPSTPAQRDEAHARIRRAQRAAKEAANAAAAADNKVQRCRQQLAACGIPPEAAMAQDGAAAVELVGGWVRRHSLWRQSLIVRIDPMNLIQ